MRIALAQLNFHIGNFNANYNKIKEAVNSAKKQNADLIVFSELCVSGYPPRDFLEFKDFIKRCDEVIQKVCVLSTDIGIIVGSPCVNPKIEGKDLFNSAYFISEGKVQSIHHKALLPTYDVFDEYRYFEPGSNFNVIEFKGKRIALTICEDIWNLGNENPLYTICPMDFLMEQNPDIMINISASPFNYDQDNERIHVLKANVNRYKIPAIYVNHSGAQTELIFDGGSLVMNAHGQVFEELPYFEEVVKTFETEDLTDKIEHDNINNCDDTSMIHDALIVGIRDYFHKLGFKKAILGLSGGIDSAITLYLAVQALGAENVLSVLMPSPYSSQHSVDDSVALAKNLNSPFITIPIKETYESFLDLLKPHFKDTTFNVTEENIQARTRAVFLMALSNKFGYILLNTSNKSEAAVGYGTLYGDMCGGLSVLGDVYKTRVYQLAEYINRDREIIPVNIIQKPPSAELRPDQKDSDSLPEYDVLDQVLFNYIELQLGPNEIIELGFDRKLVERILKLVNTSEYKRAQTPPILRVSPKAFGMGRRMPIVGKYLS